MLNIRQISINHEIQIITIITRRLILGDKTLQGWLGVILDMKILYKVHDNIGFSLYTILSIYYIVATLEVEQTLKEVSANSSMLPKNIGDRVQLKYILVNYQTIKI